MVLTSPVRLWLTLLSLVILYGCGDGGQAPQDPPARSWPQTATVADLSHLPADTSAAPALAKLKTIGFDTVLLDARALAPAVLQRWIGAARTQRLRSVVRTGPPRDALARKPGQAPALRDSSVAQADGVVVTLAQSADVDDARTLQAALRGVNSGSILIADPVVHRSSGGQRPELPLPAAVFAAIISDDTGDDIDSLLNPSARLPPTPPARTNRVGDEAAANSTGLARWYPVAHCPTSGETGCSEDVRLLVIAFMQDAAPVTGVIEDTYWHDVYASLIRLRHATRTIRQGRMQWYATDEKAGVLAYRFSNDQHQHVLVAINVSDSHHDLPLPSGFMAVSKIRLWASYDPAIRELVTSRPITLPARSAVVVVDD